MQRQRRQLQKKNNEEVKVSFVVSNPNTKGQNEENKSQSFVRKVLGFFYRHNNALVRVLVCGVIMAFVFMGMRGSIDTYKTMNGMGINPIELVFMMRVRVVVAIVQYFVPGLLLILGCRLVAKKKIGGKMPKILPADVKISLGVSCVLAVCLGGYFYRAFVSGGRLNTLLVQTSGQVAVLVFLVVFFILLSLLNLCHIGEDEVVDNAKITRKN